VGKNGVFDKKNGAFFITQKAQKIDDNFLRNTHPHTYKGKRIDDHGKAWVG
jgi:hypothetical protein